MASRNADLVRSWATVHISGVESWLLRAGQAAEDAKEPAH